MIEDLLIHLLLNVFSAEQMNTFLSDPRTIAVIIGALVSISGALLGTFLLLRKMSLTADAISHTVLLGIVVAFLVMINVGHLEPDISSPWLIVGAAAAGVVTVVLTEIIQRSGLVKADAALGLAFPLLFAVAIILISRFADSVHLDEDAVLVGEIGVAWANTESHCLENCAEVIITPDDARAEVGRKCVNCNNDIRPRDPEAVFEDICTNCGTYTAGEAWRDRLIDAPPLLIFWPKSLTVMSLITLLNAVFVMLFYKELKLASFDTGLAKALGLRPGLLHYLLMIFVSVTAVGAFDAVGSVLVVAFFIIPAATAYLLIDRYSITLILSGAGFLALATLLRPQTGLLLPVALGLLSLPFFWMVSRWMLRDRLAAMLLISPLIGILGVVTGYNFARGEFLGVLNISDLLATLDPIIGLEGYTTWNTSISAAMVVMSFMFFLLAWVASPGHGLVSTLLNRRWQQRRFAAQMFLGHIYNHEGTPHAAEELAVMTLHDHLQWTPQQVQRVMAQVRAANWVQVRDGLVELTERGRKQVQHFQQTELGAGRALA